MEEKEVADEDEPRATEPEERGDAKRFKVEDGASTAAEGGAGTSFPRATNSRTRNYRRAEVDSDESSQPAPDQEPTEAGTEADKTRHKQWYLNLERGDSDSSSDEDSASPTALNDSDSDINMEEPAVLSREKPKHKWFMVPEIMNRQIGLSSKYNRAEIFQRRCYGSLHCVQRLELMYKLEKHEGCVNSLNFHPNGSLLASGSDDLNIVIWDWPIGKHLLAFDSKHRGNIFQSKFMHLSGDLHIVSCARDGQVRLHQVSRNEGLRSTRRLGVHRGPVHKISLARDQPHLVLSVGEDACIMSHDVRTNKSMKLAVVQNAERKVPLYSVHTHPINSYELCVSGRDQFVRVYDQRKGSRLLSSFVPGHIDKKVNTHGLHVTCAVYNYNGTEILASYNDEDIYLFDASLPHMSQVQCYQGHRNGATIKGVSFFGPKSEYVVSGSDCGHVYFWDKTTESIVQWMLADDNGVVNVLEPHPQLPIICTSGLDWDVKVWVPSYEQEPEMKGLEEIVRQNLRCRLTEQVRSNSDMNDSQVLWMLWRHLRTTERLQRAVNEMNDDTRTLQSLDAELTVSEDSSDSELESTDSDEGENLTRPVGCSPS